MKNRILEILEKLKDEEIKPTKYRYICFGGGNIARFDEFGIDPIKKCRFKGEVRWDIPACEKCDGKCLGNLDFDKYETYLNNKIKVRNETLDQAIKIINQI